MNRAILSIFILAFLLCGCDKLPFLSKKQEAVKQQEVSPAKEEIKISGALLARVNDWAIGIDDFNTYMNALKPTAEAKGIVMDYDFKSKFLRNVVRDEVLAQLGVERGMDRTPEVTKALRESKTALLASKMVAEIEKNLSVSSAEVQDFYDKNKQMLRKPETRKVREIAVKSEFDAKDINIKLLQGSDFAELAKTQSVADTAAQGGDLGYVTAEALDKKRFTKYWQTAFSLEKGAVSQYFKGEDGKYYILKAEDVKEGETIALKEIEEQIKEGLRVEKTQKEVERLVNDFKTRAKVEVKEDMLR
jgi:peptidyl-prolyl cis-trans isomerase C